MIPIDDLNPAERALHAELSKMTDADLDRWATTPIGFDPNVRRALVLLRVRRERAAADQTRAKDIVQIAARVWSLRRIISVRRAPTGWDVNLRTPRRGDGVLASDTRDRWTAAHSLDHDGRVICHKDCQNLAGEGPS